MLAELAAANAAFAIIKKTVQNTGDLARVANQMSQFVGAKTELEQKVKKKKKSLFSDPEAVNDMEEFLGSQVYHTSLLYWACYLPEKFMDHK